MLDSHERIFLKAELRAGLTFSKVALTSRRPERTVRNRALAKNAYSAFLPLMQRVSESEQDNLAMKDSFQKLKGNLVRLGEIL
jgi:hypothetical protein